MGASYSIGHQLAVLRAAARSPSEATVRRVQSLARLDAADRRRLLERFWDRVLEGVPLDARVEHHFRAAGVAELPEQPTEQQLDAWLELAELSSDEDFVQQTRTSGAWFWEHLVQPYDADAWQRGAAELAERAMVLVNEGVNPADPRAEPIVRELVGRYARAFGREDTPEFREWLRAQLARQNDPRAPRYWQLVGIVSGREPDPRQLQMARAYTWMFEALQHSVAA